MTRLTPFPFSIAEALEEPPQIRVVDVGAMDIGSDQEWQPLADEGLARVVGFEPVAAECDKLNARAGSFMRYLPYAVGDGTERTLYVTSYSACTSLYEPNAPFVALFQDLPTLMMVRDTPRVRTHRMDDIAELREHGCDYLKLDIQGAERDALAHAVNLLEHTLVVHTEVSFVPMYRQAPMVGEIDSLLRERGFMLHRFLGSGGRTLLPTNFPGKPPRFMSQTLWSDVVYVKDYTDAQSQTPERWVRLAVIMHVLYGAWDLAWLALSHADRLAGSDLAVRYRDAGAAAAQRAEAFNAKSAPDRESPAPAGGWLARLLRR